MCVVRGFSDPPVFVVLVTTVKVFVVSVTGAGFGVQTALALVFREIRSPLAEPVDNIPFTTNEIRVFNDPDSWF